MIRSDREIKDIDEILNILEECEVCHLAMTDGLKPYVVPLNFGYTYKDSLLELYFHCSKKGKKVDILKRNPNVFFQMNVGGELIYDKIGCKVGYKYRSVMGEGEIEFVENSAQKADILKNILFKLTKENYELSEKNVDGVAGLRLKTKSVTGKSKR